MSDKDDDQTIRLATPATFCLARINGVEEMHISFGTGGQLVFELSIPQIRLGAQQFDEARKRIEQTR